MATLKDVAEKSGVTVTTVSRVLNNRGYISEKTKAKVYAAMKELNYQPNEVARAMTRKYTNIIGIIVPSLLHPFFNTALNFFEKYASQYGFKIMVCNSNRCREKELEYIDMLKSNRVAGIVLCTRSSDMDLYFDTSFPVISFERMVSDTIPGVICDNYQGGVLAVQCLANSGRKRLLILSGSVEYHLPADDRIQGFVDTCKKSGVEGIVCPSSERQFENRDYSVWIENALTDNPGVDGIFATSDVIAAQVIQVCTAKGIRIPGDISLVGFDDVELATLTTPRLTTIHQPIEEMCRYSIQSIVQKLNGETVPVKMILPVSLVKRESTENT
ncbi:LacI family DNA-binding transcriptional regulator [Breznakiella homolactica]|uniref:LacI family DNA-binding transcriptional regulator n=1 Tax=Breznakiella homolactica TaxID=2798577 RepID=A0A7T7XJH3_9SPIR|nr:LacI family DNA-binding transcriptional regulator [Breznakiella homolactica]QQO07516.1 LacI family transcriptional regulator [Breznakiella homolactica]